MLMIGTSEIKISVAVSLSMGMKQPESLMLRSVWKIVNGSSSLNFQMEFSSTRGLSDSRV